MRSLAASRPGNGHHDPLMLVQNDGNVVIYAPYPKAVWASNTNH